MNEDTVSFLSKAAIPVQDADEVHAAQQQAQKTNYKESKEESRSALQGRAQTNRPPVEKQAPVKSEKIVGRNERVSVQYPDGSVKKDVKFKTVEQDVKNNLCVIIES